MERSRVPTSGVLMLLGAGRLAAGLATTASTRLAQGGSHRLTSRKPSMSFANIRRDGAVAAAIAQMCAATGD